MQFQYTTKRGSTEIVVDVYNMKLPSYAPTVICFHCLLGRVNAVTCFTWLLCWWNAPKKNIETVKTSEINKQKYSMVITMSQRKVYECMEKFTFEGGCTDVNGHAEWPLIVMS